MMNASRTLDRSEAASVLPAALAALMLGALVLFGAGLSQADGVHSAAHDGRHAFAFPCH